MKTKVENIPEKKIKIETLRIRVEERERKIGKNWVFESMWRSLTVKEEDDDVSLVVPSGMNKGWRGRDPLIFIY